MEASRKPRRGRLHTSHEPHSKRVRESSDLVRLSGHLGVDHVRVSDDGSKLRISVSTHRTLVDYATKRSAKVLGSGERRHALTVRRPDNGDSIVNNHRLGVDVDHLGGKHSVLELAPSSEGEERDVVIRLRDSKVKHISGSDGVGMQKE